MKNGLPLPWFLHRFLGELGVKDFFGVWMILVTYERAVAFIGVVDEIVRGGYRTSFNTKRL